MKHKVTEVKLKNGGRGLFIHVPDATVMTMEINFRAGEYLVTKKKWETPHLMEHILLGANELIPRARQFQAEFEKNGAYNNASTDAYDIIYEAECADFEWDRIVELLLTAITKPLFLDEEFASEFSNVREELESRSNNHFRHLSLALRQASGFYCALDQERLKLMDNVTVDDVKKHYKKTHTTSNMRFVIAGKLTQARQQQLKQMLNDMELDKGKRLDLPDEKPVKLTKPLYIPNKSVKNLYFYINTFMNRRLTEPESDALQLINSMLTETLYSRILGTARERGLVYGMSSGLGETKLSSNWWFGAQVTPKNAELLFAIIVEQLMQLFEGAISQDDIVAAQQYALGRYQRSGQTVGGVASGYSNRYFFDEQVEDYYQVPERIKAISREQIVDITNAMFKDGVWGIGILGSPGNELVDKLHAQISSLWS